MYKFLRDVSTMTGKVFHAGAIVHDGEFHALGEMEAAGDIGLVEDEIEEPEDEVNDPEETEAAGDTPLADEERKARNAAKARERRAAKKAGN